MVLQLTFRMSKIDFTYITNKPAMLVEQGTQMYLDVFLVKVSMRGETCSMERQAGSL